MITRYSPLWLAAVIYLLVLTHPFVKLSSFSVSFAHPCVKLLYFGPFCPLTCHTVINQLNIWFNTIWQETEWNDIEIIYWRWRMYWILKTKTWRMPLGRCFHCTCSSTSYSTRNTSSAKNVDAIYYALLQLRECPKIYGMENGPSDYFRFFHFTAIICFSPVPTFHFRAKLIKCFSKQMSDAPQMLCGELQPQHALSPHHPIHTVDVD